MLHYNPGKWLRECFPEQTKSIPSILIWTVVFLLDVALVFLVMWRLGLSPADIPAKLAVSVVLIAAFLLFLAETAIYNRILTNYRKTLE